MKHNEIVSFIWQVAELLRGPYRPNQYKTVILPLTVLRRLDCVLEPTKEEVLKKTKGLTAGKIKNIEPILNRVAKQNFHNKSPFTFEKLKADPDNISANLTNYIKSFSEKARGIIDHFKFEQQIEKLNQPNRKEKHRKKKIQLINAVSFFKKMRKSLGQKRHEISQEQIEDITKLYGNFTENEFVRIFDSEDFGYHRITVERPLKLNFQVNEERLASLKESTAFLKLAVSKKRKDIKTAKEEIEKGQKIQSAILKALSNLKSDSPIKNREKFTALLKEDITDYMKKEVLPHVPSAWIDESKTKIGYEISFNRYFYKYSAPRPLQDIEKDLKKNEGEIVGMLSKVMA